MKTFVAWVATGCWVLFAAAGMTGCKAEAPGTDQPATSGAMNSIAEEYVKLVLAVGQHDPDYVDAFYGPAEWKTDAARQKIALPQLRGDAEALIGSMPELSASEQA